ncbi:putative Medium-chain fatty-acid--CoA ligase [Georgfuchsia toluolica]|uniref:Medium-chain fatty-acid--CoA ligase n=1 Tax=Georgfuchsia toluolica TaxID=424218 RepID=A0A916J7C8_9PROT|nr:AMP-binding protein [Georgfuchsia toluolica]CAG4884803.1 putative Medium-chain fatty-acid--CoA ligase [Georgfuchsia toluolica]
MKIDMQVPNAVSAYRTQYQSEWISSGLWKNRTVADEAFHHEQMHPDDPVVFLDDGDALCFGEVITEALALAAAFQRLGLRQGDVVSFQLPNWREVVPINIASAYLGLVVCPIIPIYRSKELQFILRASRSRLHLTLDNYRGVDYRAMLEKFKGKLPDLKDIVYVRPIIASGNSFTTLLDSARGLKTVKHPVDPNSVKLIMYTSGTTGIPKGVLHSHNSLRCFLDNTARYWNLCADDVMLMPSPVTHITGLALGLELPFSSGIKCALMEKWNADAALVYIRQVKATVSVGATPFLEELIDAANRNNDKLPSMRLYACGGATVPPELIVRVGLSLSRCRAFRVYGSTETPLVTLGFVGKGETSLAAHTDGKVIGYQVKVVDGQGGEVAMGQEGEILTRGPSMFLCYADSEHNADAFDNAGYFRTGDLGHLTPEGGIVISGRKKDLIIRGGENISAKEVEDVLYDHSSVREVAVVSMPHARLGEGVCACVIPSDGQAPPTLEALVAACNAAGLAKQKWPERVEVMSEFPRTASGKIKKNELRDLIHQKLSNAASAAY